MGVGPRLELKSCHSPTRPLCLCARIPFELSCCSGKLTLDSESSPRGGGVGIPNCLDLITNPLRAIVPDCQRDFRIHIQVSHLGNVKVLEELVKLA
mgnify:CR=1 FL=1